TLPLFDMFSVTPSSAVRGNIPLGAFLKRHRLGVSQARLRSSGAPGFNRIDALMTKPAGVMRQRARIRQTIERERTETHLPRTSIQHKSIEPRSSALPDFQIEAAAVAVHAGPLRHPRDLQRR